MGAFFSQNRGRTDDPDPVTSLTSRERYLIQKSWEVARKTPTQTGAVVLLQFFQKYPDYLALFPFRDVPLTELNANRKFQTHCNSVIYALSAIVDNLNEPELLVEILSKTGKNHKKLDGVPSKSFWELKDELIAIFKTLMDKETVAAWDKTLNVAVKIIENQF